MSGEETTEKKSGSPKNPVNFRVAPETAENFREAAKAFQNQDVAMNEMLDALRRENQRMDHPEYAGDMDAFQGYLKLISAKYMDVLNAMSTAQERAKIDVQQILDSKDTTIIGLQTELGTVQTERDNYKKWFNEEIQKRDEFKEKYNNECNLSKGLRTELSEQKEKQESALRDKDKLNEILSRDVSEAQEKLKEYAGLPELLAEKDRDIKRLNDEINEMKMQAKEKEYEFKVEIINKDREKEQALSELKEKHQNSMLENEKKVQAMMQEHEKKVQLLMQDHEQKMEALRAKIEEYRNLSQEGKSLPTKKE